jgi:hypothetical protein
LENESVFTDEPGQTLAQSVEPVFNVTGLSAGFANQLMPIRRRVIGGIQMDTLSSPLLLLHHRPDRLADSEDVRQFLLPQRRDVQRQVR